MIGELIGRDAIGASEVDLICALNKDHALDGERDRLSLSPAAASRVANAAVLGMPRQRRRPRPRAAGADRRQRRRGSDRRGLPGPPADRRRRRASRRRERDHADAGIARAGPRARHAGAASAERSRDAWPSWRAFSPSPRRSTCSGPSPRSSSAPTISCCPKPEMVSMLSQYRLKSTGGNDAIDILIRRLQTPVVQRRARLRAADDSRTRRRPADSAATRDPRCGRLPARRTDPEASWRYTCICDP